VLFRNKNAPFFHSFAAFDRLSRDTRGRIDGSLGQENEIELIAEYRDYPLHRSGLIIRDREPRLLIDLLDFCRPRTMSARTICLARRSIQDEP